MGFLTLDRMKDALLGEPVTALERLVLLDMAVAVDDTTEVYSWGHERLVRALGRTPGTKAAKSAIERVLGSLAAKGLIVRTGPSYRGRNAEYRLVVLDANGPRSDRGPFGQDGVQDVQGGVQDSANSPTNGPRFGDERAPVLDVMGPGQTEAPLPSLPVSLPVKVRNSDLPVAGARAKPLSAKQVTLVTDTIAATVDDYWLAFTSDSTMTVATLTALEVDHLTGLSVKARRARIAVWCGLAKTDGHAMEDQDDRLLDLLHSHGIDLPDDDQQAISA